MGLSNLQGLWQPSQIKALVARLCRNIHARPWYYIHFEMQIVLTRLWYYVQSDMLSCMSGAYGKAAVVPAVEFASYSQAYDCRTFWAFVAASLH